MRHINMSGFTQWRRYDPEWLYIVPNQLLSMESPDAYAGDMLRMELGIGRKPRICFVTHHMSHLAQAVFQSPFERGLAVAIDEYGEFDSVTIAKFKGAEFDVVKTTAYPNSLGVFYAAITEYCGFTPNSDEWKLMGAAAYGDPARFAPVLEKLLEWDEREGEWILDGRYIEHSNMKRAGYLNERLLKLLGLPLRPSGPALTQDYFDLAAGAQAVFEKRLTQLLSHYGNLCGETNLAAAGGCFMNCLANGKILGKTPFKRLFVPYSAADNGGAPGSALWAWAKLSGKRPPLQTLPPSPYLGPEWSGAGVEDELKKFKLRYRKLEDPAAFAAKALTEGKLLGWFQGRMEFGERALGNRSILADPRDLSMKDRINAAVKYREAFRPFAPAVLAEKADEWFSLPEGVSVPYMEQAYPVKAEKAAEVPAVVHADGSSRLQTVSKDLNPLFHRLISNFEDLSGVPMLVNTSFNLQGEPIVCSPADAVRTFFT
jgi:carbamoyltransferase